MMSVMPRAGGGPDHGQGRRLRRHLHVGVALGQVAGLLFDEDRTALPVLRFPGVEGQHGDEIDVDLLPRQPHLPQDPAELLLPGPDGLHELTGLLPFGGEGQDDPDRRGFHPHLRPGRDGDVTLHRLVVQTGEVQFPFLLHSPPGAAPLGGQDRRRQEDRQETTDRTLAQSHHGSSPFSAPSTRATPAAAGRSSR